MDNLEFDTLESYLEAYEKDRELGVMPIALVADHLGRTPAAVSAMIRSGRLSEIRIGKNRFVALQSLLEMKNAQDSQVERVEKYLIKQAKAGVRAVFYEPVMAQIGLSTGIPADRNRIGQILGQISRKSDEENGILLTVLVHRKTAGTTKPGPGFPGLAEALGYEWDEDSYDEFVEEQTDLVLEHYAA
jgi:hypothetical protein